MQSRIRILLTNICLGLVLVIALAVAYGCSGPPVAVFQASAISGQAPLSVTFTNQSRNADVFTWDFGDGEKQTTSTLIKATSHQYEKAGTFNATLTAAKKSNPPQANSTTATITVSPGPLAQVIVGPGQIDLGMGMTQQFVAVGADQYANRISGLTFTWSVQSGAGTIDSKGLFTAPTAPGTNAKAVRAQAT
ncbi:MAG TPA: PKD domain-containing protein, partial [Dehalococcoidia bacterium]|nr:PKD domain-containing protein [Dehalococcoidia bacterium]